MPVQRAIVRRYTQGLGRPAGEGAFSVAIFDLAASLLRQLPAEPAHRVTLALAGAAGPLLPRSAPDDPALAVQALGLRFPNPIGLAAGFDKNAQVPDAMARFGFGFVECGTVTPRPQAGNPKPRLFRLTEDRAVINRMGFNNGGIAVARANLMARQGRGLVGINIGANKDSDDRIADYRTAFDALAKLADYVTVNISSPNTPGLRGLQNRDLRVRLAQHRRARLEVHLRDAPLVPQLPTPNQQKPQAVGLTLLELLETLLHWSMILDDDSSSTIDYHHDRRLSLHPDLHRRG